MERLYRCHQQRSPPPKITSIAATTTTSIPIITRAIVQKNPNLGIISPNPIVINNYRSYKSAVARPGTIATTNTLRALLYALRASRSVKKKELRKLIRNSLSFN